MSGKSMIIGCMIAGIIGIIVFCCMYKSASVVVSAVEKRNEVVNSTINELLKELEK